MSLTLIKSPASNRSLTCVWKTPCTSQAIARKGFVQAKPGGDSILAPVRSRSTGRDDPDPFPLRYGLPVAGRLLISFAANVLRGYLSAHNLKGLVFIGSFSGSPVLSACTRSLCPRTGSARKYIYDEVVDHDQQPASICHVK